MILSILLILKLSLPRGSRSDLHKPRWCNLSFLFSGRQRHSNQNGSRHSTLSIPFSYAVSFCYVLDVKRFSMDWVCHHYQHREWVLQCWRIRDQLDLHDLYGLIYSSNLSCELDTGEERSALRRAARIFWHVFGWVLFLIFSRFVDLFLNHHIAWRSRNVEVAFIHAFFDSLPVSLLFISLCIIQFRVSLVYHVLHFFLLSCGTE